MSAPDPTAFPASEAPARRIPESLQVSAPGAHGEYVDVSEERSAFLPVVLLGAAVLGWLGFQCFQLVKERSQLQQAHAAQEQMVQNATAFRGRLDTIARETQLLADNGNPNAKLLVDELRKRGITINPNAAPATPAGTAAPAATK